MLVGLTLDQIKILYADAVLETHTLRRELGKSEDENARLRLQLTAARKDAALAEQVPSAN